MEEFIKTGGLVLVVLCLVAIAITGCIVALTFTDIRFKRKKEGKDRD